MYKFAFDKSLNLYLTIMKRIFLIAIAAMLLFPAITQAQRAIGLRFGGGNGVGTEISFQTPFDRNRAEIDLGFGSHSHYRFWSLTGLYQWVMPIDGGFYWYLGVGPTIGNWETRRGYYDDDGLFLAAALNAGVEYNFTEIPLQISIDTRPELGIVNRWESFGFGLALGIRYRF